MLKCTARCLPTSSLHCNHSATLHPADIATITRAPSEISGRRDKVIYEGFAVHIGTINGAKEVFACASGLVLKKDARPNRPYPVSVLVYKDEAANRLTILPNIRWPRSLHAGFHETLGFGHRYLVLLKLMIWAVDNEPEILGKIYLPDVDHLIKLLKTFDCIKSQASLPTRPSAGPSSTASVQPQSNHPPSAGATNVRSNVDTNTDRGKSRIWLKPTQPSHTSSINFTRPNTTSAQLTVPFIARSEATANTTGARPHDRNGVRTSDHDEENGTIQAQGTNMKFRISGGLTDSRPSAQSDSPVQSIAQQNHRTSSPEDQSDETDLDETGKLRNANRVGDRVTGFPDSRSIHSRSGCIATAFARGDRSDQNSRARQISHSTVEESDSQPSCGFLDRGLFPTLSLVIGRPRSAPLHASAASAGGQGFPALVLAVGKPRPDRPEPAIVITRRCSGLGADEFPILRKMHMLHRVVHGCVNKGHPNTTEIRHLYEDISRNISHASDLMVTDEYNDMENLSAV